MQRFSTFNYYLRRHSRHRGGGSRSIYRDTQILRCTDETDTDWDRQRCSHGRVQRLDQGREPQDEGFSIGVEEEGKGWVGLESSGSKELIQWSSLWKQKKKFLDARSERGSRESSVVGRCT